jgi:hypothetical protein
MFFLENEREKIKERKNLHCSPTGYLPRARTTTLERGQCAAPNAMMKIGLWPPYDPLKRHLNGAEVMTCCINSFVFNNI